MEHYSPLADEEETRAAIVKAKLAPPLFPMGRLCASLAACTLLAKSGQSAATYFARHVTGDWSETDKAIQAANHEAIAHGRRVYSSYETGGLRRLWIITEANRSLTTLLLAADY